MQTYSAALKGFTVKFPVDKSASAVAGLLQDERVDLVEQDSIVTIAETDAVKTTQTGVPWGLDRIDQRNRPLNGTFVYTYTGAGVRVFIIDTGIRISHNEFEGRANAGIDFVGLGEGLGSDCHGHGTHVAGTVGGKTYGVAKQVLLTSVRVLDCDGSGTVSAVIAGIDWITGLELFESVANMSLSIPTKSEALGNALKASINGGVTYAIAAGDSNSGACSTYGVVQNTALIVGATNLKDRRARFSNWGVCLALFAPGTSIKSAWSSSDTATATISSTGAATPHVAGVAALYFQRTHPFDAPAMAVMALRKNATTNVVSGRGAGSPNRLLFTDY